MRKISGNVVWTRPMSLSRAAKLLSRFSAVDNGSSAAVSVYLQRASEAFNHLVQFHSKRVKVEENPDSPSRAIEKKKRAVGIEDEVVQIASKNDHEPEPERKEKKNKRRKEKVVDSSRKKRRVEGVDS